MTYTIRLLSLADGRPFKGAGEYLVHFDPGSSNGRGSLLTTPDREQAKRYPTSADALEEVLRPAAPPHDRRPDGALNRPLTAYTVEIHDPERFPEARDA
jgi:hypothetical protein